MSYSTYIETGLLKMPNNPLGPGVGKYFDSGCGCHALPIPTICGFDDTTVIVLRGFQQEPGHCSRCQVKHDREIDWAYGHTCGVHEIIAALYYFPRAQCRCCGLSFHARSTNLARSAYDAHLNGKRCGGNISVGENPPPRETMLTEEWFPNSANGTNKCRLTFVDQFSHFINEYRDQEGAHALDANAPLIICDCCALRKPVSTVNFHYGCQHSLNHGPKNDEAAVSVEWSSTYVVVERTKAEKKANLAAGFGRPGYWEGVSSFLPTALLASIHF